MAVSAAPATEKVLLSVKGGTTMTGWVARPTTTARTTRGLIVFQKAFGVNDHHRTNGGALAYGDVDAIEPHARAMKPESIVADAKAAYIADALTAVGKDRPDAARQAWGALTREFFGIAFGDSAA